MSIRSWSYDRSEVSIDTGLLCSDPSRAIQSQKAEADINNIVKAFGVTGRLPESVRLPSFGDFTGVSDYREAIEAVRAAEASFLTIPSEIRREFENSPQLFMEFCSNPSNLPKLREWGLAPTPPAADPSEGGTPQS